MQFLTAVSPQSFATPSWKIETKYSTRVLIGNWVEERGKFTKATEKTPQCIYRKEYVPFPGHRPDQISRWYGKRRVEGLPYKHLITHHQEPSHYHLISTYDDHYNRHGYNPGLPPRRTWNGHKMLWLPEKADFPLLGIFIIWDFPLHWAARDPQLHRAEACSTQVEGPTWVTLTLGGHWNEMMGRDSPYELRTL
ncbi:hypothetical protein HPG69_011965 [Diceros bicornis minor]|uniref:Uncharacterized protein n=1 Tax=Diceros bicornis minor TaxID=77932 RepID=A0A7J7EE94_DICBM|nr:hypothetical protein HPG69_011965 [Diceros bicornis minor]